MLKMNINKDGYVSDLDEVIAKPWGNYRTIDEADGFKVKRIEVEPGASLSLQKHSHRSEYWIVVRGQATVTKGEKILTINENQMVYLEVEEKHRVANKGDKKLVFIEVQYGDYLGEDDIVRFEDSYGRV